MKTKLYVQPEILPSSGYVYVDMYRAMLEEEIEEDYKSRYILLTVQYDGRRKKITQQDVMKAMEKEGLVTNTGTGSIFGNFYLPTNKLKEKLATINHRKDRVT